LSKEIKEDASIQKDLPCSLTVRINIMKMAILLKVIYRFSPTPNKIPVSFFTEIEKSTPKIHVEEKETTNIKSNHKQNEQCWRYFNNRL
jgi:hypothetical protein